MAVPAEIFKRINNRNNITWTPDSDQKDNIECAIEEAEALIRDRAGKKDLDLSGPDYRGLWAMCTWYLLNNRRAEFEEDYRPELIGLRLSEGFGCGKEESQI